MFLLWSTNYYGTIENDEIVIILLFARARGRRWKCCSGARLPPSAQVLDANTNKDVL
jgi:hypothetical protein